MDCLSKLLTMPLAKLTTANEERDAVLWNEMKQGNEFAFREIFDNYSDVLFQYGTTISKDRELIKDCIQELFITIWANRSGISIARSTRYYLLFSLRRLILKKIRAGRNFLSVSALTSVDLRVEAGEDAIVRTETQLHRTLLISNALKALPERQKEIIFLKFYQELKYDEIEKIMNLNNQVVRNTLYKALSSLRRQLEIKSVISQLLLITIAFVC